MLQPVAMEGASQVEPQLLGSCNADADAETGAKGALPGLLGARESQPEGQKEEPKEEQHKPEVYRKIVPEGSLKPISAREHRWVLAVMVVSGLDLLNSSVLSIMCLVFAFLDEGVSLYCMAMQAAAHVVTSCALLFRLMPEMPWRTREIDGSITDECLLEIQRRRDLRREQAMSLVVGCGMLLSCVSLSYKAIRKLEKWNVWYLDHSERDNRIQWVSDAMAWWGFTAYAIQTLVRGIFYFRLRLSLAWRAFTVSVVSMLFFMIVGIAFGDKSEWSWKADAIAAIVLVVVMLLEGIRTVITNMGDVDVRLARNPHV